MMFLLMTFNLFFTLWICIMSLLSVFPWGAL